MTNGFVNRRSSVRPRLLAPFEIAWKALKSRVSAPSGEIHRFILALQRNRGLRTLMKTPLIVFAATNALAMLLFYGVVMSIVDQARMEERDYYDASDSITFMARSAPILIVTVLLNFFWGIKALSDIFRRRSYLASLALVAVGAAWTSLYFLLRLNA